MKITGESIVLAGSEPAHLLFKDIITDSIVVRSSYMPNGSTLVYEQGQDYIIDCTEGIVVRTPGSRIPDFSTNVLYGQKNFDHSLFTNVGNTAFFVWADYETNSGTPFASVTDQSALLPKMRAKLEAGDRFELLAYGDSITAGCDMPDEEFRYTNRYVQLLRERYPKAHITMENVATGGDTTNQGIERMEDKVLYCKPDLVLLAFGMNDHNIPGYGVPLDKFRENLSIMVDTIRERTGAEVMLLSTFPPHPDWAFGSHQMEKYAEATERVASVQKCAYADVYSVWASVLKRKDPSSLLANNINHPNCFGHWLYLQALEAVRFNYC